MASPPIEAHRLLGDGATAALITPGGEIDWWCSPSFGSTPLLWSLLDSRGARARWRETRLAQVDSEPAGTSTRTELMMAGRRIECWDALVDRSPGGSAVVRLVRLVDDATNAGRGPMMIDHELSLGGFDGPWATWDGDVATVGQRSWRLHGGAPIDARAVADGPDDHHSVRRVGIQVGSWSGVMLTPDLTEEFDPGALAAEIERNDTAAADDSARMLLPRHHGERSRHAIAVMRACTSAATGAAVASPTTSLPEAPGGDRQFDYRYSWLRDNSLAGAVAAQLGFGDLGRAYLGFLRRLGADGILNSPLTDVGGQEPPEERPVDGVAGWARSQPVRVGNAARGQLQFDAIGTVLDGVLVHAQTGGRVDADLWSIVTALADRVCEAPDEPSSGVWELRQPRWLVSADVGRWMALDRAIRIARWRRPWSFLGPARRTWRQGRDAAAQRVLDALGPDGSLPQSYRGAGATEADASALLVVIAGLLSRHDRRTDQLIDATLAALEVGPFLYRYEPGGDDGFDGVEGAFVPASWWAVEALATAGRVDEAEDRANRLCAALPALVPEEIDPISGAGRGNVPLLWSHIEAARALYLLEVATLRRRYGPLGLVAWRAVQYVRLKRRRRGR